MLRRSHERAPGVWLEETRGDRDSRRSASRKEGGIRPPRRQREDGGLGQRLLHGSSEGSRRADDEEEWVIRSRAGVMTLLRQRRDERQRAHKKWERNRGS